MRNDQPVTQRERDVPDALTLASTAHAQGRITHCNTATGLASRGDAAVQDLVNTMPASTAWASPCSPPSR